jgi:glucosamine 6-phosphate synthetase-like amidotransferase/phosphosugar isomerase protein
LVGHPRRALVERRPAGELKDVLQADDERRLPRPLLLLGNQPKSSIARRADAVALAQVDAQTAVTHTQAYVANLCAAFSLLATVRGGAPWEHELAQAPESCARALEQAESWALERAPTLAPVGAAVVAATGLGAPAALQAALMLKEVACIPAEGLESREAATSGMYALGPGQLVLGLSLGRDPILARRRW